MVVGKKTTIEEKNLNFKTLFKKILNLWFYQVNSICSKNNVTVKSVGGGFGSGFGNGFGFGSGFGNGFGSGFGNLKFLAFMVEIQLAIILYAINHNCTRNFAFLNIFFQI